MEKNLKSCIYLLSSTSSLSSGLLAICANISYKLVLREVLLFLAADIKD